MKKHYLLLLVFCLSCFMAMGEELSEDQLKKLQRSVKIGSVNDNSIKGDDGVKTTVVKFYTTQNEDDEYKFRLRVTVELTDRSKNTYFAQLMVPQGIVDSEYTGEDAWKFEVSEGDLERPKVSAYAIQYGIQMGEKFIPLAEEFDDVDTLEELTERTTTRMEQKPVILHQYSYRDGDEEVAQSQWK